MDREGGIIKKGSEGLEWTISLYEEHGLPVGLVPRELQVIEVGYVKSTGYMWMVTEKKVEHKLKMIGKLVSYDTNMSGYLEKKRIRKLKGVKARELMIWTPCSEIFLDEPPSGIIRFKATGGLTVGFPVEAFAAGQ